MPTACPERRPPASARGPAAGSSRGQGSGIGPAGISITAGISALNAVRSAWRSSAGEVARRASAPKLSTNFWKSGLRKSEAISRLPNDCGLDAPHVAVGAVVDQDDHHRDAVLHGGGQFLRVEQEAAVAGDRNDRHIRARDFDPDRRRHAPPERALVARRDVACAGGRPGTPCARRSRAGSVHRRRCRPPAARRGSPPGSRSAVAGPRPPRPVRRAGRRVRRRARRGGGCAPAARRAAGPARRRRRRRCRRSGRSMRSSSSASASMRTTFSAASVPHC